MEKFYSYLTGFYRIALICVFIGVHLYLNPHYTQEALIMYAIYFIYALLFTLLKTNKWMAYGEFIVLLGLQYFYNEQLLYFLMIIPFTHFVSSRANKFDIFLFTIMACGFSYLETKEVYFVIILGIAMFITLGIFHTKFFQIEYLETKLFEQREYSQEYKKELTQRKMELENVLKMLVKSRELNEIKNEDQLLDLIIDSAKYFFNAHYAVLYLKEHDQFIKTRELGKKEKYDSLEILNVEEHQEDKIQTNMLQAIIQNENQIWGMIQVFGKTTDIGENQKAFFPFTEMDYEVLLTYIQPTITKLNEIKLRNNDGLTGIPNRRYFLERFVHFQEMGRRGEPFSVLILDIDHFKHFNDTYGHETGDEVLKIVAETTTQVVRKVDVVGRLGGEEFSILLFKPKNQAVEVAERVRKMISLIPAVDKITVSIGVAHFGTDGNTWEELYNHADKALYYAKEHGRNQVREYDHEIMQ